MPVYNYKALDGRGELTQGIIDASSPREAREKLRSRKLFVTEMAAAKRKKKAKAGEDDGALIRVGDGAGGSVGFSFKDLGGKLFIGGARAEMVSVTRLLATLLKAGIPLIDAISSVINQVSDKYLSTVLRQIREAVRGGVGIADALGNHPELFDPLYVNMVRAGEEAGALDDVLTRLANFMQAQARTKNKVSAALTYPLIMMVLGGGVVVFLLAFVVPKIVGVVQKRGTPLPLPTKILITIKDMFLSWWWLGALLAAVAFIAWTLFTSTENGAMFRDRNKLKLPIVGDLFRKQSVARFAHTFATLLRSGVQATDCLRILSTVVDNRLLGKVLLEVRDRIIEGQDISTPIKRSQVFPPVVGDMIAIGEESGSLEELLERIAEAYDEEVEITTTKATSLIEPIIIVIMAGIVGFIVLAVVLPLVQGFKF
ncbi:MAG: type II secretion system F family protein [Planctomycetota bacterium]